MENTKLVFARHGLRCTKQRAEIYSALADTDAHPTAEELYWLVRERRPEIGLSLATVYNTLEAFCEHRLCRKLPANGGGARFDADLHEHLHVTTRDGRVMDVPDDLGAKLLDTMPQAVLEEIEQRMGIKIARVRVDFVAEDA